MIDLELQVIKAGLNRMVSNRDSNGTSSFHSFSLDYPKYAVYRKVVIFDDGFWLISPYIPEESWVSYAMKEMGCKDYAKRRSSN